MQDNITVSYYVPETLSPPLTIAEFKAQFLNRRTISHLGQGTYGWASKVQLGDGVVVVKELYARLPLNNNAAPLNDRAKIMKKLVETELEALYELSKNPATAAHIPPLVAKVAVIGGANGDTTRGGGPGDNNDFFVISAPTAARPLGLPALPALPAFSLGKLQIKPPQTKEQTIYIVSRYIKGDTLDNIANYPGLSTPQTLTAIRDSLATGLRAIHAAGWLHRDIKPNNVFIEMDEAGKYVGARFLDLGTACRVGSGCYIANENMWQSARLQADKFAEYLPADDMESLEKTVGFFMRGRRPARNSPGLNYMDDVNLQPLQPPAKRPRIGGRTKRRQNRKKTVRRR